MFIDDHLVRLEGGGTGKCITRVVMAIALFSDFWLPDVAFFNALLMPSELRRAFSAHCLATVKAVRAVVHNVSDRMGWRYISFY